MLLSFLALGDYTFSDIMKIYQSVKFSTEKNFAYVEIPRKNDTHVSLLKLVSLTFPDSQNMSSVPVIYDLDVYESGIKMECGELNPSNPAVIMFQNYSLVGDILDTKRHMFSFDKKHYDIAQTGQDWNKRINANLIHWSMTGTTAYSLFLKVKAFGIDPTDQIMKSAFRLATYQVNFVNTLSIKHTVY